MVSQKNERNLKQEANLTPTSEISNFTFSSDAKILGKIVFSYFNLKSFKAF